MPLIQVSTPNRNAIGQQLTQVEFQHAQAMSHTSSLPRPNPWSVDAVLQQLPTQLAENSPSPLPFLHYVQRLKIEKREGWRRFGISKGESIADHMYRMSIITMLAPPALSSQLDIPRCTKMALVHDIAEGLVGDLTPVDGVPKVEKNRREAATMDWIASRLLGNVQGGMLGKAIRDVWQEYEDGETLESKFVHDVDKVELLLQMVEYERDNDCKVDLSEFTWVARKVCLPEMKDWAEEILDERRQLWKSKNLEPREPIEASTIKEHQDAYYDQDHETNT